jgi:hypothetical protein
MKLELNTKNKTVTIKETSFKLAELMVELIELGIENWKIEVEPSPVYIYNSPIFKSTPPNPYESPYANPYKSPYEIYCGSSTTNGSTINPSTCTTKSTYSTDCFLSKK